MNAMPCTRKMNKESPLNLDPTFYSKNNFVFD